MKFNSFIYKIDINRPLMFLCGPASSDKKSNRRLILSKYLNSYNAINKVKPFPIIVDDIFPISTIRQYDKQKRIKVTVLEEIVSAIAYRTYIFLDTMSTGYELGQFVNSRSKNRVRIFVDEQYDKRISCSIGAYIKDSFDIDKKEIKYKAAYDAQGHIFFKNNKMPRPIKRIIDKDFLNYKNEINFSNLTKSNNNSNGIYFDTNGDNINVTLDLKSAFYLMAAIADKYSIVITKPWDNKYEKKAFDKLCKLMKESLFDIVITNSKNVDLLFFNQDIKINIENYPSSIDMLYHIYFLLRMIAITSNGFGYYRKPLGEEDFNARDVFTFLEFKFADICHMDKFDKQTIDQYIDNPDLFIYKFKYKIKGKSKEIITYRNNSFGQRLRSLHIKIDKGLHKILPTDSHSYAYKSGMNTKICISNHKNGIYFSKLDIHSYFNSVKYRRFLKSIRCCDEKFENKFVSYYDDLKEIIRVCFYKHKLPIGFITSPKISDFYLYDLDKLLSKARGVEYTRYADDILISSNNINKLKKAKKKIENKLKDYKLILNDKCIDKALTHEGDSIKFLGINIVRQIDKENRFTISAKTLVSISKNIEKYLNSNPRDTMEFSKVKGLVAYVKNVSEDSYNKLRNMVRVKTKRDINMMIYWS